ncbi:MAG: hypothetical protein HY554_14835 [Elusimicrobia bacterium]|nr:hypothetical protein [Elusimicrobiota bacterium]
MAVSGLDVPLRSGEYRVELSLGNAGGPARRYPGAFAGLHVEVENGSVREVSAASEGAAGRVLFPGDAERGTLTHFQADFGDLGPGRQGRVGFTIAPYREPVRVRYRGWIPGGCVPRAGRRLRLPANRAQAEQDCMRRWPLQDSPAGSRCAAAQPPGGPWLEELACLTAAPAR